MYWKKKVEFWICAFLIYAVSELVKERGWSVLNKVPVYGVDVWSSGPAVGILYDHNRLYPEPVLSTLSTISFMICQV